MIPDWLRVLFCMHLDAPVVNATVEHQERVSRVTGGRYSRARRLVTYECFDCGYSWRRAGPWGGWSPASHAPLPKQKEETC